MISSVRAVPIMQGIGVLGLGLHKIPLHHIFSFGYCLVNCSFPIRHCIKLRAFAALYVIFLVQ